MSVYYNDAGIAFTASHEASVSAYEHVVFAYLGALPDAMTQLEALLEDDPEMPMAWCFRGYLLQLAAHPQFAGEINRCIDKAEQLCQQSDATEREKSHVEALRNWSSDRAGAALEIFEAVLREHPLDMLALRCAHYLHFYNGEPELMRDSTARVQSAWDQSHEQYGYFLGMHAFGLEESGEYDAALDFGQRAVTLNPADVWATHAVAHVFEMQGQCEQGIAWLQDLQDHWQATNNFRYHVHWHEALFWLGLDEPKQALSIYDNVLAASIADDFYLDLCNNASLLWRLEFAGVSVGGRWQVLAEASAAHAQDQELVFASLHYLIPLAVTGSSHAQTLRQTLAAWGRSGSDQGQVCDDVGIALADAILSADSAPDGAAKLLLDNAANTFRVGGSQAQRDIFRLLAQNRQSAHSSLRTNA